MRRRAVISSNPGGTLRHILEDEHQPQSYRFSLTASEPNEPAGVMISDLREAIVHPSSGHACAHSIKHVHLFRLVPRSSEAPRRHKPSCVEPGKRNGNQPPAPASWHAS